jgi:uncharacterized protein Yka (UPF0111/DUF47 family)
MRISFFPSHKGFFDPFIEIATRLAHAAKLLEQGFSEPARFNQLADAIASEESKVEMATEAINLRIIRSWITPMDHEDAHHLSNRMRRTINIIGGTAKRARSFGLREHRKSAAALSSVLSRSTDAIELATVHLAQPQRVMEYCIAIKRCEEEGDATWLSGVAELFESAQEPITVLIWKEMLDLMEEALDECDDVSNVLETIAVKRI